MVRSFTMHAIETDGLTRVFGDRLAVEDLSLAIPEGTVFGFLGPNGAGKTTTVEILEGYRARDGGEVEVLGFDPGRAPRAFCERIGVVLQSSALWPNLTVAETLALFAGYYARRRGVHEVLELVGLAEKRDARVRTLSGGQRRRLDLGVALVGDPDRTGALMGIAQGWALVLAVDFLWSFSYTLWPRKANTS